MTRKITLSAILIALIAVCYLLMFGNQEVIRKNVASVGQLETASKELDTKAAKLEKIVTTDYETQKTKLSKIIEEYQKTKKEYDNLVPTSGDVIIDFENSNLKDIYDVDFLWTIVGNYATEEGIDLKFDIQKNTTSASSMNNNGSNYIVCDLKFVITGNYINLTDFIYDLEDDDRLNFEINNFEMKKVEDNLQVTLTVREIKVNSSNLISNGTAASSFGQDRTNTIQTIDSITSNTTENSTNNTNSTSNAVSKNESENKNITLNDVN